MYLYLAFFKDEILKNGKFFSSGTFLEHIKKSFPNYVNIQMEDIDGCIVYLRGKDHSNMNPYVADILNVEVNDNKLEINYNLGKSVGISNDKLNKQIYHYSLANGLVNKDTKYPPNILMLDKENFDNIRKGTINARRITNNTERIDELKRDNNWSGIVDIFEPLDNLKNHDCWNNVSELSEIAFACSKVAEMQNGLERDKKHLDYIKKYRNLCVEIYERCIQLKPTKFQYPSGIGYRYYTNVMEITKQKGRKDSNANDEIDKAIFWFDKSLELYPNNIKDLSRKGYLLLEKKLDNMKFNNSDWSSHYYKEYDKVELDGLNCLKKVIEIYEELVDEDKRNRNGNYYIKSLYRLSKYSFKKVKDQWNEYACSRIKGISSKSDYNDSDYQNIVYSLEQIEKCLYTITNCKIDDLENLSKSIIKNDYWGGSPVDMFYQLGNIFLSMFLIKKQAEKEDNRMEIYGSYAEEYLQGALNFGAILKRNGNYNKNTWFVSEKLARYYIVCGDYKTSIKLLEKSRDGYAKNTYVVALLLEGSEENILKAKQVLENIINDKYNKAAGFTLALLLYVYEICGQSQAFDRLMEIKKNDLIKSEKLLSILGLCEVAYES